MTNVVLVEVTRLELATSASRTQRSTKLSHTSLKTEKDRFRFKACIPIKLTVAFGKRS